MGPAERHRTGPPRATAPSALVDSRFASRDELTAALVAFDKRERAPVIVPLFTPPARIDATNVQAFAETVAGFLTRHGCMVIDCSRVEWVATSAMRVMEIASRDAQITLVHPSPAVHLMAAIYGVDVRLRGGRSSCQADESASPTPRVMSVHANGEAPVLRVKQGR